MLHEQQEKKKNKKKILHTLLFFKVNRKKKEMSIANFLSHFSPFIDIRSRWLVGDKRKWINLRILGHQVRLVFIPTNASIVVLDSGK